MIRTAIVAFVCSLSLVAFGHDKSSTRSGTGGAGQTQGSTATTGTGMTGGHATEAMGEGSEKTCGQMMKEHSKYSLENAAVMTDVADNLEAHAAWVGTKTKEAKTEHDAMMKLAKMHRSVATQLKSLHDTMLSMQNLPNAPHDMKAMPAKAGESMNKLITEQREFAQMLSKGADEMEHMMQEMKAKGTGGAGQQ